MRSGLINNRFILENEDFIGINLGFDYISEHEYGIDKILEDFNAIEIENNYDDKIDFKETSLYRVNSCPDKFILRKISIKRKTWYMFLYSAWLSVDTNKKSIKPGRDLTPWRDSELFTAWADGSFGIMTPAKHKNRLIELMKAFQDEDVIIGLGKNQSFKNGGLKLIINSKL